MTPEGKVKAAVIKLLNKFGVYYFMPVQTGYGKKTLDFLFCAGGRFSAIETKAPGKVPTPLQEITIQEIKNAGGVVFVIDSIEECHKLEAFLNVTCADKPPAQDGRSAGSGGDHQPVPQREAA